MKILVTGGLGWTAESIVRAFVEDGNEVTRFDLDPIQAPEKLGEEKIVHGDVSNFKDVLDVASGIDVIAHLAVAVAPGAYNTPELPFAVNVQGTYNVLEAARRLGVKRVVLLGSAPFDNVGSLERKIGVDERVSSNREDHLYDLTKRLQEEIAEDFAQTFGMSILVLRVGHIVDGRRELDPKGRPLGSLDYGRGFWVCRYDVAGACLHGVHKDLSGFNCYHVIGGIEAGKHFDLLSTEKEFGFTATQRFEKFR